jgi:hypothetical protein
LKAHINLGKVYKVLGQFEKCLDSFLSAILIDEKSSVSFFYIGNIYLG